MHRDGCFRGMKIMERGQRARDSRLEVSGWQGAPERLCHDVDSQMMRSDGAGQAKACGENIPGHEKGLCKGPGVWTGWTAPEVMRGGERPDHSWETELTLTQGQSREL